MKVFSITDVGQKRETNQDFLYCNETAIGMFHNMFIVADGMGGHNAGDFASRFCVECFTERIRASSAKTIIGAIEAAITETNELMIAKARGNTAYEGMGTTFVFATIAEDALYVANIGDSRLYIKDTEQLKQITQDHSLVEEMIRNGEILREEARLHPNKNVITRAFGMSHQVTADFFEVALQSGDIILMCSDGLSNMVDDNEIFSLIHSYGEDMEACARALVNRANENGGKDNIAIILIAYD